MTCPDTDTLAALGSLADTERAAILDHAGSCESCRPVVLELLAQPPALADAETLAASAAAPPRQAPDTPPTIDRYRIERRIGAGAMGVVFAAYDPELARPLAVKVLRAGGSAERMRREAQALAKLTHPNVVAVYDVGEHAGSTFVAMALVDGANLRTWLSAPRTTAEIVDAIRQAAHGLDAAHRAGIVHRDIKPDNIFVARTGEVLVGDFGLARSGDDERVVADRLVESSELTRTGSVIGTPAYMAPEQIDGDASVASDQFALCVTAWEALYGQRPFTGKTIEELATAMRAGPPDEPGGRKVPSSIRAAIRRGLAADPAARHPSLSALLAAFAPRRRKWPYAAAALGIVAVAGTAIALREDPQATAIAHCEARARMPAWTADRRARAVERFTAMGMKPDVTSLVAGMVDRYADGWTTFARTACVAATRRELSEPVLAATYHCLERRAAGLEWALVETQLDVITTITVLESLEPIESCRSAAPGKPPSPELRKLQAELDQAATLVRALSTKFVDLAPFVVDAEKLGDPSAMAEASYLEGAVLHVRGRDAVPALRRAVADAERAQDDRTRTRASALLAVATVRAGRFADAALHRDVATSALARSTDPITIVAVEQANVALAFARQDLTGEVAALRRIEAAQLARFGEWSLSLADARFSLAGALQRAHDPSWSEVLDRALATTARFKDYKSELLALEEAALRERAPAARIAYAERGIAIAHRDEPARVPGLIRTLGYDYELIGDYERALAAAVEALQLLDDGGDSALRTELLENAAAMAFEVADQTDDKALSTMRLGQALAFLDQLPSAIRNGDAAQVVRGRTLLLQSRYRDAIPLLTTALATAERAEPANPNRIAIRSFALSQALWEIGGTQDRDRARALADQAAAQVPAARALFEENREAYGVSIDRVERLAARIEAWRRTHR